MCQVTLYLFQYVYNIILTEAFMIAFSTFTPPKKFSKQYLGTTLNSDLRSYAPSVIDMTDLPDDGEEEAEG